MKQHSPLHCNADVATAPAERMPPAPELKLARDRALDADFAAQMLCPHGRNLDEELCEPCADDDAELDAL